MIELIDIEQNRTLDDYSSIAHLAGTVQDLRTEARQLVPKLKGRTVWMVNSTAQGGGVAGKICGGAAEASALREKVPEDFAEGDDGGFFHAGFHQEIMSCTTWPWTSVRR